MASAAQVLAEEVLHVLVQVEAILFAVEAVAFLRFAKPYVRLACLVQRRAQGGGVAERHALFGFTLSYDEFARTLMTSGTYNTLPLEIYGMTTNVTTPVLYALGTVTTLFSFTIILVALGIMTMLGRRQAKTR